MPIAPVKATMVRQLQPLVDALKRELLQHPVLHADETPVAMLKPDNGKTHRAYLWSYCRTRFVGMHAVVCRPSQPVERQSYFPTAGQQRRDRALSLRRSARSSTSTKRPSKPATKARR